MDWLPLKKRRHRKDYNALPTDPVRLKRRRCRIWSFRRLLFCLACAPFLVLFAILCQGIPPSYEDVRIYERRLPQHTVAALTRVDDRPARYLRFPGHLWGHGLNNILQEACVSQPPPLPLLAHQAFSVCSCPIWPTSPTSRSCLKTIRGHTYPSHGRCTTWRSVRHTYPSTRSYPGPPPAVQSTAPRSPSAPSFMSASALVQT